WGPRERGRAVELRVVHERPEENLCAPPTATTPRPLSEDRDHIATAVDTRDPGLARRDQSVAAHDRTQELGVQRRAVERGRSASGDATDRLGARRLAAVVARRSHDASGEEQDPQGTHRRPAWT